MLSGLKWSSWQAASASATGTMQEKSCQPNCAEGKTVSYPVDVTLSGTKTFPGHPDSYAKVTLHYPDSAPPVYSTSGGKTTVTHPSTVSAVPNPPAR